MISSGGGHGHDRPCVLFQIVALFKIICEGHRGPDLGRPLVQALRACTRSSVLNKAPCDIPHDISKVSGEGPQREMPSRASTVARTSSPPEGPAAGPAEPS